MNKLMMTLAFATLIGGTAMAQDDMKADASTRADHLTERMTTQLKLNDDQTAKVKDINERYAKDLGEAMKARRDAKENNGTVDREAEHTKIQAITEKKNAELKTVLTPEQMTEWQKMQAELREKGKERMQERKDNKDDTKKAE